MVNREKYPFLIIFLEYREFFGNITELYIRFIEPCSCIGKEKYNKQIFFI